VSRQADRLIVGKLLGVATLGIYSIAVMLVDVVDAVVSRVTMNVFFPIFSQVEKEGAAQLRRFYYRARLPVDAVFVTGLGALAVLGSLLVDLVWDDRYAEAGWMFEILCVRVAMSVILYPCDRCLLAMGEGRYPFYRSVVRSIWVVVGVPVGFATAGIEGLIVAAALAEVPVFFVLWPAFFRRGMLRVERELLAFVFFGAGFALATWVEPWLAGWWA
jgi:O-antigen/teichoic acid export membrane protein